MPAASASDADLVVVEGSWEKQPEQITLPVPPEQLLRGQVGYALGPRAREVLLAHAAGSPGAEVGGLLIGGVYQEGGTYLVTITDALPARHTDSGATHVTFTAATWLDLIAQRIAQTDKMTVGWYHTHPGLGVFLSSSDRFIHQGFFGEQPWYVALVLDPASRNQGAFVRLEGRIVRCQEVLFPGETLSPRSTQTEPGVGDREVPETEHPHR